MKELDAIINEIDDKNYIINLLGWEAAEVAPNNAVNYINSLCDKLSEEIDKTLTSDKYYKALTKAINSKNFNKLNELEKHYILALKDNYKKIKKIPEEFYKKYNKLKKETGASYSKAKEKNDYKILKPYLKKLINMTKEYYRYIDKKEENVYNIMLNAYEKDLNIDYLNRLFKSLKREVLPIINKVKSNKLKGINNDFSPSALLDASKYLLSYIGFDLNKGVVKISNGACTGKYNNEDIRITIENNNELNNLLLAVIHEGGHALFEENIDKCLKKYKGYTINKHAVHESISRFYENMLGRNINFWKPIYKDLKKILGFKCSLNDFYKELINVHTKGVRTEADELTYIMHIIIRYETERDIFSGKLRVDDLEKEWIKKYKEYLGIKVDENSILQDVHWANASFGYFPAYLVGTIFDGMLFDKINNEVGDIDEILRKGDVLKITNYISKNILKYGDNFNIRELSKIIFNKDLETNSLINYFKKKYL